LSAARGRDEEGDGDMNQIKAEQLAQQLTERSIQGNAIAHESYDSALADELQLMCDDSATEASMPAAEYWGTDDEGNEWRVHLDRGC
jgi:hypothetical protein